MISFHANNVSVTRENWGDLVFFGDEDSERYLMLQAADSYDEQDVRLGMDDIYIETCGQGWSWYGNIERFELSRNHVFLHLSSEAATEMGNDGKVEASFELDEKTHRPVALSVILPWSSASAVLCRPGLLCIKDAQPPTKRKSPRSAIR